MTLVQCNQQIICNLDNVSFSTVVLPKSRPLNLKRVIRDKVFFVT